MKTIGEIITYIAVFLLVLSICSLDSGSIVPFIVMLASGGWIAGFAWNEEEERLRREKQRRMYGGW